MSADSSSPPSNSDLVTIRGGCHCQAVRFEGVIKSEQTILDCNCSICSATGFKHLIVPHKDFKLLSGEDKLTSYKFNTRQANHLFCSVCGIKSFYQPRSHPTSWSVNLNAVENSEVLKINIQTFDGKNWEKAKAELKA